MSSESQSFKVIGIVGFGRLGQYLVNEIQTNGTKLGLKLGFVWNRTKTEALYDSVGGDKGLILDELTHVDRYKVDLIVEIGSPSCLADKELENKLIIASNKSESSLFIPTGALWVLV
ncbi:unnamed protein product [Oppiella nova]|uniref:Aspartate/homoserine dehydrogenase NAD-binding domain-containing protein n=1 Tax=Oppiella nova TaxID=334625 RepID=A0A7R9LKE0_9ACAR|nr:unnamed protein product [Oppiella nova]CAG2164510.1 unnamed protein product [Oppiella nova]